ncbi:hypothetical protein PYV61_26575, partial [Roseisolibacter sp. H3M3-2]
VFPPAGEAPWATARVLLGPLADAPGLAGLAPAVLARLATVLPAVRDAFPALPPADGDEWAVVEAARAAVEEVAAEVPVLVVVASATRADPMTRRLLLALARRLPVPGVCLATSAPADEMAEAAEWAPLLDLPTLHRIDVAELAPVAEAAPLAQAAPPAAATRRRPMLLVA